MEITNKLGKLCDGLGLTTGVAALYLASSAIINVAVIPIQVTYNGLEECFGTRAIQVGTLVEKSEHQVYDNHYNTGKFRLQDGKTVDLIDTPNFLEGKFSSRKFLPGMEVGRQYKVTSLDGFNINVENVLDVKPILGESQ